MIAIRPYNLPTGDGLFSGQYPQPSGPSAKMKKGRPFPTAVGRTLPSGALWAHSRRPQQPAADILFQSRRAYEVALLIFIRGPEGCEYCDEQVYRQVSRWRRTAAAHGYMASHVSFTRLLRQFLCVNVSALGSPCVSFIESVMPSVIFVSADSTGERPA